MIDGIAGDGVAIAGDRDHRRGMRLAVDVADQTADPALERGNARALGHDRANLCHPDVDRDMLFEQGGIDAQLDIARNVVAGMVGHDQDPTEAGRAKDAVCFVLAHRKAPTMVHHSRGMAACARSHAARSS